jgi:hypothetical protein
MTAKIPSAGHPADAPREDKGGDNAASGLTHSYTMITAILWQKIWVTSYVFTSKYLEGSSERSRLNKHSKEARFKLEKTFLLKPA